MRLYVRPCTGKSRRPSAHAISANVFTVSGQNPRKLHSELIAIAVFKYTVPPAISVRIQAVHLKESNALMVISMPFYPSVLRTISTATMEYLAM